MIVNVYALLAGSVALLQLLFGSLLGIWGLLLWRRWCRVAYSDEKAALEDRAYLLFLQACFLVGLNLVSWPLLYLVLQSYVPEWPGIMCIYGVTRIGVGSAGISGALPALLGLLQVLEPVLVFLTGVWLVLYSAHRRSQTAWLLRTILAVLIVVGVVSALDASAEIAYLAIPKKNEALVSGCCPVPDAFVTAVTEHEQGSPSGTPWWLTPTYAVSSLGVLLALGYYRARSSDRRFLRSVAALLVLPILGIACFSISLAFVAQVVTPAVLKQPGHHCLYDLVPRAPLVVLALVLLAWGSLSTGWTVVAGRLAGNAETQGFIGKLVRGVARRGQIALLISILLILWALLGGRG